MRLLDWYRYPVKWDPIQNQTPKWKHVYILSKPSRKNQGKLVSFFLLQASIRLGKIAIKQKCANLKICSLDSSLCKQLLLDLKFQEENLKELSDKMKMLIVKVESFEQAYENILLDPVPRNIRGKFFFYLMYIQNLNIKYIVVCIVFKLTLESWPKKKKFGVAFI